MKYVIKAMKYFFFFMLMMFSLLLQAQNNRELLAMQPNDFFAHPKANEIIHQDKPNYHLLTIATFQATNLLREKLGLPMFQPNRSLYKASLVHVNEMIDKDFFSHINPYNKRYETPLSRIENKGGDFQVVAENIALVPLFQSKKEGKYSYRKVNGRFEYYDLNGKPLQLMTYGEFGKSLVTDWYKSKGHRKNLTSDELTHLGLAVRIANNKRGGDLPEAYAVQNFGAP